MPPLPQACRLAPLLLGLLASPGLAQTAAADLMFARLDSDGNGSISTTEMTTAKSRQFAFADSNDDGVLSAAEIEALKSRLDRAKASLGLATQRLDTNQDGAISRAEYTAQSPIFALLDTDNDGNLTLAEVTRAKAILHP